MASRSLRHLSCRWPRCPGEALLAVLLTASATVLSTQLTRSAQSHLHAPCFVMYVHITMMALLLPVARALKTDAYLASAADVGVFLPLWVVSNYCLVQALALAPAGLIQIVFGTGPAQVAVLSRVFLAERFSLPRAVAVALAFGGVLALAAKAGFDGRTAVDTLLGSLCAVAAVFASACYKVAFKVRLGTPPPHMILGVVGTLGAVTSIVGLPLVVLLAVLGLEDRWWSSSASVNWYLVFGSAAVDLVYNTSVAWGLAVASPIFVSVGLILGTPVNLLIDAVFNGVAPNAVQYFGAALIGVSCTMLVLLPQTQPDQFSASERRSDLLITPSIDTH
ncbi:unnamed protein product [Effrenium voratum]|uniref:EamA domain-containing protein n=1 Tax=Effrenium voratum TaxID=2562239 RepID=A0AA36MPZ9_9DINO|nr:unnamed protein product [Effrenium voratum]CAJ1375778.1 unnamed protein product [Effrenium voratum]CAJ1423927.1 unnamed protein product [Effrenium voratum]